MKAMCKILDIIILILVLIILAMVVMIRVDVWNAEKDLSNIETQLVEWELYEVTQ